MGKWFLEKMNGSQASRCFARGREVNRSQNDRARVRMTGAEVVKKFLPEIVGCVHVEDEKVRFYS